MLPGLRLIGNDKVAESYGGVPAMPESVLISQNGTIVEVIVGLKSKNELEKSIRKALNLRTDASPGSTALQPQK